MDVVTCRLKTITDISEKHNESIFSVYQSKKMESARIGNELPIDVVVTSQKTWVFITPR